MYVTGENVQKQGKYTDLQTRYDTLRRTENVHIVQQDEKYIHTHRQNVNE